MIYLIILDSKISCYGTFFHNRSLGTEKEGGGRPVKGRRGGARGREAGRKGD